MKLPSKIAKLKGQIAIAVSGGGDSMALLRMAHEAGCTVTALSVDHALRQGSATEARQVKQWCKALGIPHVTLKWRHGAITTGHQAKARKARYDLMASWCARKHVPLLLTAHTKDDQAETVLMRQRRTTSTQSLAGIWPETEWQGVVILRPLLGKTRAQLRRYLTRINQPWLEDPSNTNETFERVRLRKAGVSLALAADATKAQALARTAKAQAQAWFKHHVEITAYGLISFPPSSLFKLSALAQDEALKRIIIAAGGKPPELAGRKLHLAWLKQSPASRRSLGGTLFAKRKNQVLIAREPVRIDATPLPLNPKRAVLWDNRFKVTGPKGSYVVAKSKIKALKRNANIPAFVDDGLPVIIRGDAILAEPHLNHHPEAKITLHLS